MFFINSYHSNIVCGFFNDHPIRAMERHSFSFDQRAVFCFYKVAETHTRHSTLNKNGELMLVDQFEMLVKVNRWLIRLFCHQDLNSVPIKWESPIIYLSFGSFDSIFHVIWISFFSVGILSNAWIFHRTRKLKFTVDVNFGFVFLVSQSVMKFDIFFIGRKTGIFRIKLRKPLFLGWTPRNFKTLIFKPKLSFMRVNKKW